MSSSMIILSFIPTWLIFTAACISPGPNTFLVMSVALSQNRKSALWVTLGIALGGFVWAFVSLVGVSQLLNSYPGLLQVIAILGGSYLCYIGFKTLRSVLAAKANATTDTLSAVTVQDLHSLPENRRIKNIAKGVITTLSNPKVAMLWMSLSSVVPVSTAQMGWLAFYALVIGTIVFCVYGTIGLIFSETRAQQNYLKHSNLINSLFAAIFIALGLFIFINHGLT
ncbi:MAG: LysE family translocator [Pseudomonadales bacterium]|nr:LysE family translocator [Pseudomonadales bacterium]